MRIAPDDEELLRADRGASTRGLPLFGEEPKARATDPATSHTAARSMREAAESQRRACEDALLGHPLGLTADEIDHLLHWRPSTAGRRLGELVSMGRAVRTDRERRTAQGRPALVHAHPSCLDEVRCSE